MSHLQPQGRPCTKASALLLVLISTSVLALAVLGFVALVHYELQETSIRSVQFRCQQLAESGISVARVPGISSDDPTLDQTLAPGETFHVEYRSESARLNINYLLASGKVGVLERLFRLWKVADADAAKATQALYDWTHPESTGTSSLSTSSLQDQGNTISPARTMTRTFSSVAEMELLTEMRPVKEANPHWKDAFTIWGPGQLDLNEAAPDLISALCNIPMANAVAFTVRRAGSDARPYTSDDLHYATLPEALIELHIPTNATIETSGGAPSAPLTSVLTVTPSFRRIVSTGSVGNMKHEIHAIVQVNIAGPSPIMEWDEL